METTSPETAASFAPRLRRTLTLWDLILYGIIVIQPTAPMPAYGVFSNAGQGHVVTSILIAMVAMVFTAMSYGRMARAYPSAGSAYTYVGRELHPSLGYVTGWSMTMDYILNPLICTIWCTKAMADLLSGTRYQIPYPGLLWPIFFAVLFTALNLRGVQTSARINKTLCAIMERSYWRFSGTRFDTNSICRNTRKPIFCARSTIRKLSPSTGFFMAHPSLCSPTSDSMAFQLCRRKWKIRSEIFF